MTDVGTEDPPRAVVAGWWIGQLLLLPIAPGRYLHDLAGFLSTKYLLHMFVDDMSARFRGYRIDWETRWSDDSDHRNQLMSIVLPFLIGFSVLAFTYPVIEAAYAPVPVTMAESLTTIDRLGIEFIALNVLAFAIPTLRDVERALAINRVYNGEDTWEDIYARWCDRNRNLS